MKTPALSSSLEDYLEAVAELAEEDGHAHCKDVAARLGVKMPSVTTALRTLAERGLVAYCANRPVELTARGRVAARAIRHRHGVLVRFLRDLLRLPSDKAARLGCRLEHILDEDAVGRLEKVIDAIADRPEAAGLRRHLDEVLAAPKAKRKAGTP